MEGLMDANDVWQEDDSNMEEIVVDYYNNLFTLSQPKDFTELLNAAQLKVSMAMNEERLKALLGLKFV